MRTYGQVQAAVLKKGYQWFNDELKLNCVWERTRDAYTDVFDDHLYIAYVAQGKQFVLDIKATTKPGLISAQTPKTVDNVLGTAVIVPGQYVNAWDWYDGERLAKFTAEWEAANKKPRLYPFTAPHFRQCQPLNYWRDFNKDGIIDHVQYQLHRTFFTHWHNMSQPDTYGSGKVGNWSEGCMGYPEPEVKKFIDLVRQSVAKYGTLFTGTILETKDFI